MHVRMLVPLKTAQAMAVDPKQPLTADVRCISAKAPFPARDYAEIRPDPKVPGALLLVLPETEGPGDGR